jgi:hypothetical protein
VRDLTLSDFPFLASLAASANPTDRRIWLRVASDHFVAAEANDLAAIETFTNAIVSQLRAANAATRLEIARKLAPCLRTPLAVLAEFERLDSDACDFVLQHAVAYPQRDLTHAMAKSARRAEAIAKRSDLSPQFVEILAAHENVDVPVALASNESVEIEGLALARLLRAARERAEDLGDLRLAEALLRRRPVRPECAVLFLIAGPSQRVEILLAAQRMQLGRPPAFAADSAALDELELAAVARKPDRFVAVLAEALDCDSRLAQRIVADPSGEPLAVALASLGASHEVLVRVLISNDLLAGASYQRIRALARLNNALDRNAAVTIVAALRGDDIARRRQPQPVDVGTRAESLRDAPAPAAIKPTDSQKRRLAT